MLTRCQPLLGTFVEVTAPKEAASAIDAAFSAIAQVQVRMSFHDEGSDLAALRRAAPGAVVQVSPATVEVLRLSRILYEETDGLFDVTVGTELARAGFLPLPRLPFASRRNGNGDDIEIVDDTHITCHAPLLIDLGGIAKGYAVDHAVEAMRLAGAGAGLVNAGGDIAMFGPRQWDIALRDADDRVRGSVSLADCAIASSANLANRRRRLWRVFTPHIGRGGKPVLARSRVSVVAQRCVIADAMTKIAMGDPALAERLLPRYGARLLDEYSGNS